MTIVYTIIALLAGLLIGSFLNVCVFRMPRDLLVVAPRSFCPECEHAIAWYDNIPLLSYALLRGRCRHCGKGIPIRYPLVELATGVAFAASVAYLSGAPAERLCHVVNGADFSLCTSLLPWKYCLYSAILIALIASDFETQILPDEFTLGGTVLGIVFAAFAPVDSAFLSLLLPPSWNPRAIWLAESVFAAAFASGTIWFVGWAYEKIRHREGMGFGDVKMIAMIGAFVGLRWVLVTLILGSLLGSIVGVIYAKFTKKEIATTELPFGSFLGIAALAAAAMSAVAQ